MTCPTSPEDGYHRFKLESKGVEFATVCMHCGAEKLLRPFADETAITIDQRGHKRSPRQDPRFFPRDAVAATARAERARGGAETP